MKLVKNLLRLLLLTLPAISFSQTIIPTEVGRWCLEKNEEVKVYKSITLSKDSLIHNKDTKILLLNDNIKTYQENQIGYGNIINSYKGDSIIYVNKITELNNVIKKGNKTTFWLKVLVGIELMLFLLKG